MTPAEEIKLKLDLVDVVAESVRLQPAGGQSLKGLCPFHGEKTPSFYVHRDKQFWHCFGCGEGGDVFTFYQKIESVEFPDALRDLAKRAGVTLPEWKPEEETERAGLLAVIEDAARFFEAALRHPVGERARAYLAKRGLEEKTLVEFRIGYAPASWEALVKGLRSKGHADERIAAAGLAVASDKGRGLYDRFRDRVMIPLRDERGVVVGFTGRIMPDSPEAERTGKYVNTPETKVYRKRRLVFALDRARPHIKAADFAVLVEGNMDAVSSHQAGVKNVVAVSGTAFTEEQIDLLKRSCSRIALAFDADVAGQNAMSKALPHAWKCGLQVMVVLLPPGFKDPDEVIRRDPALWKRAIAEAKDMLGYAVERAITGVAASDPYGKRKALASLKGLFALVGDPVLFDHWVHALAERLQLSDTAVREALAPKGQSPRGQTPESAVAAPHIESRDERLVKRLFSLILNDFENLHRILDRLDLDWIPEGTLRALAKTLKAYYTSVGQAPCLPDGFFAHYAEARRADPALPALEPILLLKERDFSGWSPEQLAAEAETCAKELEKSALRRRQKEMLGALAEAEKRGDRAAATKIAERLEEIAASTHN